MPMLGDLLALARKASGTFEAWLERSDPNMAAQVRRAAEGQQLSVTGFVRGAMADFNRFAAEEDWVSLISSLRETDDPGTACLLAMVHWRLTVRGCGDHTVLPESHGVAEKAS
jgi:hypothetical protein